MWLYDNKEIKSIEDFGELVPFGFIYRITNLENNKFYIGKKQLISKTNIKLGKKEKALLPIQRGRAKTKKLVEKESNWLSYWGSCKPLLADIKTLGDSKFKREIIMICYSKKMLTYWEAAFQIKEDVLLKDNNYNDTVFSHFYRRDFGS
jgi:hypothetical protein